MGGARLAHGARQVVAQRALTNPEVAHEGLVGPGVHPGDDDLVDLVTGQTDVLQRPFPCLPPEGQVAGLAEPLLPQLRALLARDAPSIEEFVGRRARTDPLGDDGTVLPVIADHDGRAGVPSDGLVRAGRQAVTGIGRDDEDGARVGERGLQRPCTRPQRTAEVECRHCAGEPQGGMEDRGVGLVEIRRGGGGEPQGIRFEIRAGAQGETCRLDAERRGVLVVGGHRSCPLPTPRTEEPVDLGPLKSSIGDIPRSTHYSTHGRDRTRRRTVPPSPRMQYATEPGSGAGWAATPPRRLRRSGRWGEQAPLVEQLRHLVPNLAHHLHVFGRGSLAVAQFHGPHDCRQAPLLHGHGVGHQFEEIAGHESGHRPHGHIDPGRCRRLDDRTVEGEREVVELLGRIWPGQSWSECPPGAGGDRRPPGPAPGRPRTRR